MMRAQRAVWWALALAGALQAAVPYADDAPGVPSAPEAPVEPPPEADAGEDYEIALADTLEEDAVEVGVGATGRPGRAPRRTRRIRFRGEGLDASLRDGAGDPLAGGVIEGRVVGGTLRAGHLAPRWGRGLVFGATADPWDARATDRGAGGGRAGEGLQYRRGLTSGFETIAGTFERRRLGGASVFHGPWRAGGIAAPGRRAQGSLAFGTMADEFEVSLDHRGRWRTDVLRTRANRAGVVQLQARFGSSGFDPLAEPRRSGADRAVTVRFAQHPGPHTLHAIGSWWRFQPGRAGARAALLYAGEWPAGRSVLAFEEQHGPRRASATLRTKGVRQGAWSEWSSARGAVTLSLRHEIWGGQRFRDAVRRVSGARVEIRGPGPVRFRIAQTAFRVGFGESLYLREAYSDRLVLRALTGSGERTSVECLFPAGGGRLTLSMQLTRRRGTPPRMVWSLDWARLARTRR